MKYWQSLATRLFLGFATVMLAVSLLPMPVADAASCPTAFSSLPDSSANGTDILSDVTVPASGTTTYTVWARVLVPSANASTSNNLYLRIDDSSGNNIICNADINGVTNNGSWTWIDYTGTSSPSYLTASLTGGTDYTVSMTGDAGVEVDRVIITGNSSCTPTGTGDNCASNVPPVVAISSPNPNSTATFDTNTASTVTATASSEYASIASVQFYIDGTVAGSADTSAPYTYTLSTSQLNSLLLAGGASDTHTMYAVATDTNGNSSQSSNLSFKIADNTAPTVTLTTPSPTANPTPTLTGTVNLAATASDNIGVQNVTFYSDYGQSGQKTIDVDTSSPYTYSYNSSNLSNGSHTITAIATDTSGNTATSTANVTVSNSSGSSPPSSPTVSISSPTGGVISGTTTNQTVTLTVSASDSSGIKQVQYFYNGTPIDTTPVTTAPYSYTWNLATFFSNASIKPGTYALTAEATDSNNVSATSSPVSVFITIPADITGDGAINVSDLSALSGKYGQLASSAGRANIVGATGNATINVSDLSALSGSYGKY